LTRKRSDDLPGVIGSSSTTRTRFGTLLRLCCNYRLQICALPPLLPAVAVCRIVGSVRYLLRLVDGGFLDVTPIHHNGSPSSETQTRL
jgi:hypothetical protein